MYSSQTLSYCMVCAHLLQHEHKILLYWTRMWYGYGMANYGLDVLDYSNGIALTSHSRVWFCTQLSKLKPSIAFHESEPKYCSLKIRIPLFGDFDLKSNIVYIPQIQNRLPLFNDSTPELNISQDSGLNSIFELFAHLWYFVLLMDSIAWIFISVSFSVSYYIAFYNTHLNLPKINFIF